MTIKLIYEKVQELKKIIMHMVEEVIEPSAWNELVASLEEDQSGIYRILEDDLPTIRDLKAFVNMLSAIERMAEKMTTQYGLLGASLGYKIMIMHDLSYFYENLKVYLSTNSIVTTYLSYLKDISLTVVLPKIITKMQELSRLCTEENLDKVSDFMIAQVITLEQYQENYVRRKQLKLPEPIPEKKEDQGEDFVTTLIKKSDQQLRNIYKEKYDVHFAGDEKKSSTIDYYPENKIDTDIIKNAKLLLNGIIGVKKVLDDHEEYQQSSFLYGSVYYWPAFYSNLRRVYSSLSEFDYQAIIAEKSTPFTDEIKKQLSTLNDRLEKLTCIADQFELELRLKEGTLLNKVNLIINRHNQIMHELRIPTEYLKQKHIYYKSRLTYRQSTIAEIDEQIKKLEQFLIYKNYALIDIPYIINQDMQEYIKKYYDDICMDRNHLDKYQKYLVNAIDVNRGMKSFVMSQLEYRANYYGYTIHAEFMASLRSRLLYLTKQKQYVIAKNKALIEDYQLHPYDNVSLTEMNELGAQATILKLLKGRTNELEAESKKLSANAVMKKDAKPVSKDVKTVPKDKIEATDEVLLEEKNIDKDKTPIKLFNQIQLRNKEFIFFAQASKTFETSKGMPTSEAIVKEAYLSPQSALLLHELNEVNTLSETRPQPA